MRTPKKTYRLQDPIHGLIPFREDDETDRVAWRLINTREFQRLRRIRQLGFSEMVFPGATHTRFAHSIGVFHMARRLIEVIGLRQSVDPEKAKVAILAALVHDIGHGPFSHAFEGAMKAIGRGRKHEEWTAEIITGDTEVHRVLDEAAADLAPAIAALLKREEPQDIYDTLVASQFDADRLDYLQRDRYMTGVGGGGFDVAWLLDCLEIGMVPPPNPDEGSQAAAQDLGDVPAFYLNYKGLRAGEAYLWARWYLYEQIYLHKTTRGAEKILAKLMNQLVSALVGGQITGLEKQHPLCRFLEPDAPKLSDYLALDDVVIMATWPTLAKTEDIDPLRAELADRLVRRRLLRCFDAGLRGEREPDQLTRFRRHVRKRISDTENPASLWLEDTAQLTAYGVDESYDRPSLRRVLVGRPDGPGFDDISRRSHVIRSDLKKHFYRVYVPQEGFNEMSMLWKGAKYE